MAYFLIKIVDYIDEAGVETSHPARHFTTPRTIRYRIIDLGYATMAYKYFFQMA